MDATNWYLLADLPFRRQQRLRSEIDKVVEARTDAELYAVYTPEWDKEFVRTQLRLCSVMGHVKHEEYIRQSRRHDWNRNALADAHGVQEVETPTRCLRLPRGETRLFPDDLVPLIFSHLTAETGRLKRQLQQEKEKTYLRRARVACAITASNATVRGNEELIATALHGREDLQELMTSLAEYHVGPASDFMPVAARMGLEGPLPPLQLTPNDAEALSRLNALGYSVEMV